MFITTTAAAMHSDRECLMAYWPNINFILTATVCNKEINSHTWPSGILRFVLHSYKLEAVSFVHSVVIYMLQFSNAKWQCCQV